MPRVICEKCGVEQTTEKPKCFHVAGRVGGKKLAAKKRMEDPGYFKRLGSLGGVVTSSKGSSFYAALGHLGKGKKRTHQKEK
jgi:hypothetical protein